MLTRLKISGFKNLVDVDIRFGPFTCVAGVNGVGKSNLFDAIRFLSALSDNTLMDAALSVRSDGEKNTDIRSLFHRVGDQYDKEMSFEAEMIVPRNGVDDLGQDARASITFLHYALTLTYREGSFSNGFSTGFQTSGLEIVKEELTHITQGDARKNLLFKHSPQWRKSAIQGERRTQYFISTNHEEERLVIRQHQDGGSSGRPLPRLAANLPRTVLSAANAAETPTALMARREMQSWRLLQLEPSALRKPDSFDAPKRLGVDGSHLAATLYRLAYSNPDPEKVYVQIANRLSELIDDVREVNIDVDSKRELYTLQVSGRDRTAHEARALSDGTLRFLALAILERDPEVQGLICLEEPENGIHPERIPAILQLLQDIVTDTEFPVDEDNPLRQIIINTHSPAVVQLVPPDTILVAETVEMIRDGQRFRAVQFGSLPDETNLKTGAVINANWRLKAPEKPRITALGTLLSYLNPVPRPTPEDEFTTEENASKNQRTIDRVDFKQLMLPFEKS